MKIEEKNIVRQISAFKVSVIKKLDEIEKSTWLQKKSIIKSGCLEHFSCVVSTSPGKVDIISISMT
jgi:hypothetical protein